MNKTIIKLITVTMVMCAAQVLYAQEAPPAAPPPATPVDELEKPGNTKPADGAFVKVGDKKDDGTIYWVDGTGKHGLMVYPKDLGIMKWAAADEACKNLGAGWHLPTKDELDKLYKANINLHILASYFFFQSSTEDSPGVVWKQSLSNGTQKASYKTGSASTPAVKAF
jgi:hypothetical protein